MKRREFIRRLTAMAYLSACPSAFTESIHHFSGNDSDRNNDHIKDYLLKMKNFDKDHKDDFYLTGNKLKILKSTVFRLKRIQRTTGHGNFCLLDFDDAVKIAKGYTNVGSFTGDELSFIEMVFYQDASIYGFNGQKPLIDMTNRVNRNNVVKISYSGNYLYKGLPVETYERIKKDIGEKAILTSGIRSVTKQIYLFLNKAYHSSGNLSVASRSLAPPGYSYHGVGDFDIGQDNFGYANFTKEFTRSNVYQKLCRLNYVKIRYQQNNYLGVRYEPWHIKLYS